MFLVRVAESCGGPGVGGSPLAHYKGYVHDGKIVFHMEYQSTKLQAADILTKERFPVPTWKTNLALINHVRTAPGLQTVPLPHPAELKIEYYHDLREVWDGKADLWGFGDPEDDDDRETVLPEDDDRIEFSDTEDDHEEALAAWILGTEDLEYVLGEGC